MSSSAPADGADFIPAETFSGSKLGYVFQAGSLGTGYYKDGIDKSLPPPPTLAGQTKLHNKALAILLYKQSNNAQEPCQNLPQDCVNMGLLPLLTFGCELK